MTEVALLNPPNTSKMVAELRRAFQERRNRAEKALLTNRFETHEEYTEAFGIATTARLLCEDFETIVGKYERI